jgi:hypothetical protein
VLARGDNPLPNRGRGLARGPTYLLGAGLADRLAW